MSSNASVWSRSRASWRDRFDYEHCVLPVSMGTGSAASRGQTGPNPGAPLFLPLKDTSMSKPTPVGPGQVSQRQLRVAELIRHSLSQILARGEVMDPELEAMTLTIPEVRISPDLKIATVYVVPLGGGDAAPAVKALARNKTWLRTQVAKKINLKFAADLRFRSDDRFDEAMRIDALLHKALGHAPGLPPSDEADE